MSEAIKFVVFCLSTYWITYLILAHDKLPFKWIRDQVDYQVHGDWWQCCLCWSFWIGLGLSFVFFDPSWWNVFYAISASVVSMYLYERVV